LLQYLNCNSKSLKFIDRIVNTVRESDKKHQESRFVYCYDWRDWRGTLLRAAWDSQQIGKIIGRQLATIENVSEVHVVGVSVGAFAADACIREFRKNKKAIVGGIQIESKIPLSSKVTLKKGIQSRLTLLDPFTSRGIFGNGYGDQYFGKDADFCEQFMNTDDPVPSTNSPLSGAHIYDVTDSIERAQYTPGDGDTMHSWPVAFYGLNWAKKIDPRLNVPLYRPCHVERPRGSCTRID